MYIHIGGDIALLSDSIISVISLDTVLPGQRTVTDFINISEDVNRLQYLTEDIPHSMVVTADRIYLSPLSVSILRRRIESGSMDVAYDTDNYAIN